jgi:hypothetical protein
VTEEEGRKKNDKDGLLADAGCLVGEGAGCALGSITAIVVAFTFVLHYGS